MPGDGMALDIPASTFPSALFSLLEKHFQEVAPAWMNPSPDTQRGHLPPFQQCDDRRCCSPGPCVLLMLAANTLQCLGTSPSHPQTHGASGSLQPACRALRRDLSSSHVYHMGHQSGCCDGRAGPSHDVEPCSGSYPTAFVL